MPSLFLGERTVFRTDKSLAVVLPHIWTHHMKLQKGNKLLFEMHDDVLHVILKKED